MLTNNEVRERNSKKIYGQKSNSFCAFVVKYLIEENSLKDRRIKLQFNKSLVYSIGFT